MATNPMLQWWMTEEDFQLASKYLHIHPSVVISGYIMYVTGDCAMFSGVLEWMACGLVSCSYTKQ